MSDFAKREAINRLQDRTFLIPDSFDFAYGPGAANISNITITCKDVFGRVLTGARNLTVYLAAASTGIGLTALTASGTVQAKASSGTDMGVITAKKALDIQTLANGTYILEITDTGKQAFYVSVVNPATGLPVTSRALAPADFG
jgi:hypothetical protein